MRAILVLPVDIVMLCTKARTLGRTCNLGCDLHMHNAKGCKHLFFILSGRAFSQLVDVLNNYIEISKLSKTSIKIS